MSAGVQAGGEAPRRGGASRWLKRGCGCGALFLGAVVALVLLLPSLLGGTVAGLVERGFAAEYRGKLELEDLSLAWRSRQRVDGARLLDPAGAQVARASVELPSILDLARSAGDYSNEERTDLGRVEVDFDAEIAYAEDGSSNLERALAPRAERPPGEGRGGESPEPADWRALYERLGLRVVLRPSSVTLRHPLLGADAPPVRLAGLEGELELSPGAPARLALRGTHDLGRPGSLALDLTAGDPIATERGVEPSMLALELEVEELPFGALAERFGHPELADALESLLGPRVALNASLDPSAEGAARALRVGLETESLSASARGTYADGTLTSLAGEPFATVSGRLPAALLEALAGPYLPEGAALESAPEGAELRAEIAELSFPVGAEDALASTRVAASLSVGPLAYSPGAAERGASFALRTAELRADVRPGAGPTFELAGQVDGAEDARLSARASLAPTWMQAVESKSLQGLGLDLALSARGFPTRVADEIAGQDGLLADVLGPTLSAELGLEDLDASGGRLAASFDSGLGRLDWRATYRDGALRTAGPEDRLTARVRLSPLFEERVIGPLVPLLVDLEKPADADPVELSVSDFVLPLDGDLGALSARIGLDLGRVSYRLLPGLADVLPAEKALAKRTTELAPFTVQVGDGVARYEALPLTIDGRRFDTKGSFDLEEKRFDFDLVVPLSKLGGEVAQGLDKLRDVLPADLSVPLKLGGTLTRPSLSIDSAFLETTVREAAQNALQKELQKGLGGDLQKKLDDLLGKNKKKDG